MDTFYKANISYGRYTYGEIFAHRGNIRVGNFCSIGNGVRAIIYLDHKKNWVSTYPFDRRWLNADVSESIQLQNDEIIIGNDVWIGEDVTLFHDTNIGDGAIIGSKSVVCGNIPPYAIAVGNPAEVIDYRFSSNIIVKLLQIRWWDWSDDKIRKFIPLLCNGNVEEFIRRTYGEQLFW